MIVKSGEDVESPINTQAYYVVSPYNSAEIHKDNSKTDKDLQRTVNSIIEQLRKIPKINTVMFRKIYLHIHCVIIHLDSLKLAYVDSLDIPNQSHAHDESGINYTSIDTCDEVINQDDVSRNNIGNDNIQE